jgi:hypothetical protein
MATKTISQYLFTLVLFLAPTFLKDYGLLAAGGGAAAPGGMVANDEQVSFEEFMSSLVLPATFADLNTFDRQVTAGLKSGAFAWKHLFRLKKIS